MGFNCLKGTGPLRGGSFLFTTKFPESPGTNPGVPCSKPRGGSKFDSAFHPSEVDHMNARNFRELISKK